jgi:hypothetical protein
LRTASDMPEMRAFCRLRDFHLRRGDWLADDTVHR